MCLVVLYTFRENVTKYKLVSFVEILLIAEFTKKCLVLNWIIVYSFLFLELILILVFAMYLDM